MTIKLYVKDLLNVLVKEKEINIHNWKLELDNCGDIICRSSSKVAQKDKYRFTNLCEGDKYVFLVNKSDKAYAYIKNRGFSDTVEMLNLKSIVYIGDEKDFRLNIEKIFEGNETLTICGEFDKIDKNINEFMSNIVLVDVEWAIIAKDNFRTIIMRKESDIYKIKEKDMENYKFFELKKDEFIEMKKKSV